MKRLLIIILVFVLFFAGFQKTSAQDASSSGKIIQIQYELPYPGILPDNPLYFLKAIRDNVLGFFITDPLKKADYSLLMADKRLQSAKARGYTLFDLLLFAPFVKLFPYVSSTQPIACLLRGPQILPVF